MTRKFQTLEGFVAHLQKRVLPSLPVAVHRGVQDGAELIRDTVKGQIGQYLEGPEDGLPTAPLADSTIDDRIRKGFTPNDPGLRSGEMRDGYGARVGEEGLEVEASIGSDDLKAVYFELGTVRDGQFHQPPRPELSVAASRCEQKIARGAGRMIVRALEGRPLPNSRSHEEQAD
ncbi:hypothetical protein [Acetobacter aceti]|uniref:hypothetical protein n=1 Tax=Acetobacter aceti TaxID=435 RepID=UPI000C071B7F|nr:hypothetical protein [Acetobacter aceti]